ncbi:MAG: hypothetical protein U9P10_11955 [Thermodesulfobacteriota bacterium]|nr:hypothetical protein [Thermodesulfobacteriota bacterium]
MAAFLLRFILCCNTVHHGVYTDIEFSCYFVNKKTAELFLSRMQKTTMSGFLLQSPAKSGYGPVYVGVRELKDNNIGMLCRIFVRLQGVVMGGILKYVPLAHAGDGQKEKQDAWIIFLKFPERGKVSN